MIANEFDHSPVPPQQLQPARYFAASYAGEHVAGTEFVIGAAFVAWGASAGDVILGLLIGNTLAVLTWALVCAPVAVNTRLTLYAYLEKIAGPGFIRIYSVINGILFCILAGSMITVSASAVRIPFGVAPQTQWYPTDPAFIIVALAVGAVVVTLAVLGFKRLAQFAGAVVPWMITMFLVGGIAAIPLLARQAGMALPALDAQQLWAIATDHIWIRDESSGLSLWHVAAFAWVCNLAMHGSLGDMTLLRYARRSSYGYFSALGMFIGHFMAWIAAGAMGAGAGAVLGLAITGLDAGEVAWQVLGWSGIIAVIIAGWTTSNPTLYRAGLAFQSLNPRWSRARVTLVVGIATTVISCFPFVFTRLLDFVGIMGLTLAPVGAVIVTEHWLFPRLGMTRYWSRYQGARLNAAALIAWITGLVSAWLLNTAGLHLFFLLIPTWFVTTAAYLALAALMGARQACAEARAEAEQETARRATEQAWLSEDRAAPAGKQPNRTRLIASTTAFLALLFCLVMSIRLFLAETVEFDLMFQSFRNDLLWPTALFFAAALVATVLRESGE